MNSETRIEGQTGSSSVSPCLCGKPISIHIDNLTAKDAHFLTGVIRIFTDPIYQPLADQLRAGLHSIHYCKGTGAAAALPTYKQN